MAACAPEFRGPHPINIAAVRHEIADEIHDARAIVSMGRVTDTSAVVYTDRAGERQEETWTRTSSGWKLDHAVAVTKSSPAPS